MRALRTLLLIAALLGLAGQSVALAAAPPPPAPVSAPAMSAECAEMMTMHEDGSSKKKAPCDGTFKCMVAMGCLSVSVLPDAGGPSDAAPLSGAPDYWPAVAILHGASFAPDPDPPTLLG